MMKTILLNLFRGALAVAVFGGMVGVYNYLLATKPEVALVAVLTILSLVSKFLVEIC